MPPGPTGLDGALSLWMTPAKGPPVPALAPFQIWTLAPRKQWHEVHHEEPHAEPHWQV